MAKLYALPSPPCGRPATPQEYAEALESLPKMSVDFLLARIPLRGRLVALGSDGTFDNQILFEEPRNAEAKFWRRFRAAQTALIVAVGVLSSRNDLEMRDFLGWWRTRERHFLRLPDADYPEDICQLGREFRYWSDRLAEEDSRVDRPCGARDRQFLEWYREGLTPAKIRDRWNLENPSQHVGDGDSGRNLVKSGIRAAKKDESRRG
jgi:hypothetical protein